MKKRVLITRPKNRAAKLISLLRADGIESFAGQVTEISYITNDPVPDLAKYNWLAFTSANGVAAFYESVKSIGISLPDSIKIAAVGAATADQIERRFRRPDLTASKSDGFALAGEILEASDKAIELSVLWPCAENALPDFPDRLKEAGAAIDRLICYKTEPIEPGLLKKKLESLAPWDIALFAAPSAVLAFAAAWPERTGFVSVAIGQTTFKELKESGFSNRVVCDGKGDSACAASIKRIINKKNVGK